MNTKSIYKKLFMFLFLFELVMFPAKLTKADTIVLRDGRMYTNYDVTGDRRADLFSISMGNYQGYGAYKAVVIRVNGKKQVINGSRWDSFYDLDARLYKLKNRKTRRS